MTIRSIDAANRVRSSIVFIKITEQQAYLHLYPCKKERGQMMNEFGGHCSCFIYL